MMIRPQPSIPSSNHFGLRLWLIALLCSVAVGCGAEPPEFRFNLQDPARQPETVKWNGEDEVKEGMPPEKYAELKNALYGLFGDPDHPYTPPTSGLNWERIVQASGPTGREQVVVVSKVKKEKLAYDVVASGRLASETETKLVLASGPTGVEYTFLQEAPKESADGKDKAAYPVVSLRGRQLGLYRQHCVHCHGVTGDGKGPTAPTLNPYPRDFRTGDFKFKSTYYGAKPTRGDLHRTLMEGVPGTAMPSFRLLPTDELAALVEYVVYLSMRGEVELDMLSRASVGDDLFESDIREEIMLSLAADDAGSLAGRWNSADEMVIKPDLSLRPKVDTPEARAASIMEGRKIFHGLGKCASCHGPNGMGDGWPFAPKNSANGEFFASKNELDAWNAPKVDGSGLIQNIELFDLPPQQVSPRNLRRGIYRGGRRPVDLFRRVYGGIKGHAMPAAGPPVPGGTGSLTEEQVWNVVDYIRSLPYEAESSTGWGESNVLKRDRM